MKTLNEKRWVLPIAVCLVLIAVFVPGQILFADEASDLTALRNQEKVFARVARKAKEAVVFVKVEKTIKVGSGMSPGTFNDPFDLFNDDFFNRFFRHRSPQHMPQQEYRQEGQGSGFIVSKDGFILTNNHVVGDADVITVKLYDGREVKAKVVGTDPQTDVAVIKIDEDNLPVLEMGSSEDLEVGEWVMAIGNPFGLSQTVTVGVVSAKGRSGVGIVDYEDFIQTDAAINPGNSGGPLLDLNGKAVGINTAIFSKNGGYMGIGFAIPMDMAKKVYEQLVDKGSISRGFLGVVIQDINSDLAKSFKLDQTDGVLISQVSKDSAADKAGLEVGDVITGLDGKSVKKVGPFRNLIAMSAPGTRHTLTVVRNGKEIKIKVKLGTLDSSVAAGTASKTKSVLGLTVQELTANLAKRFGYETETGVVITEVAPGSAAAKAGLAPGALVVEVNKKPVHNAKDFHDEISSAVKAKENILMLVKQDGYSRFVVIRTD